MQIIPIADSIGLYTYAIVFMVAALESTPIIGTFTPGTLMLVFFGFLVSMTNVLLIPCIFAAVLGAVVGDYVGYLLGRYGSRFFKEHKGLLRLSHLELGKAYFAKHGGKSIFIGRFVGPIRPIVPLVAGATRMSMRRFLPLNIASALLWATLLITVGYFVGEQWRSAEHIFAPISILGGIIIVAVIARFLIKRKTETKTETKPV